MKVIELYTKIANKEFIPRYIKVNDRRYEFDESDNEYYPREENDNDTLLERISRGNVLAWLNIEIEELYSLEEKKIPEKLNLEQDKPGKQYYIRNEYGTKCGLTQHSRMIAETLNEVIDYLDYFKSKGE